MSEGKLSDRESSGREEKRVGTLDPSGKTYMKAASRRWCVLKKWERGLNKRELGEMKEAKEQFRTSLELRSVSKPNVSARKYKRRIFADFRRICPHYADSRRPPHVRILLG